MVNTNAAAAAGLVTWVVLDAIRGHVSVSGACVGPIIGLVAITPACGFVQPGWAVLFGVIPTIIIYVIILFKHRLKFDDTLDVAVVHGIGILSNKGFQLNKENLFYLRWNYWCIYDGIIYSIIK